MDSHDTWYKKWNLSTVASACIVRLTNRCDQKCKHCCFRSGPNCIGQMSENMCKQINAWIPKRVVINTMGGEITVLNDYPELLAALAKGRSRLRLVTNGFWAHHSPTKFFDAIKQMKTSPCDRIEIVVSGDGWHNKKHTLASKMLDEIETEADFICTNEGVSMPVIPVGRAWDNHIMHDGSIYHQCQEQTSMIITEDGMLCRCPFGYFPWKHFSETTWHDAQEYIWGWRSEKLNEGMNCHLCMDTIESARRRVDDRRESFVGSKNK